MRYLTRPDNGHRHRENGDYFSSRWTSEASAAALTLISLLCTQRSRVQWKLNLHSLARSRARQMQ